jgi:predicted small secreted protein
MQQRIALLLLILFALALGGGCATLRGMGEDIKKLGQAIEDKAK